VTETERPRPPFSDPEFWTACFFDEYAGDLPGACAESDDEDAEDDESPYDDDGPLITCDLGAGYALLLSGSRYGVSLQLAHPGAEEPVELGWDDLAHWHPHALRWSEVDLVCRAAALDDADASYPGPYLALLSRFGPVCSEADAAAGIPLLREAFAHLPGLDSYQRTAYAARGDIRAFGVEWKQHHETGWWYPEQGGFSEDEAADTSPGGEGNSGVGRYSEDCLAGDLYSLREPDESEFPFAALGAALERARARCAALRDQHWAVQPEVQTALKTFASQPGTERQHRTALLDALQTAGCTDPAVLGALADDAGELRALVMAELLLGAEPGSLVRAHCDVEAPHPMRAYYAHAFVPVASDAPRAGFASRLRPHLNAVLRAAGLGSISHGPARVGRVDGTDADDLPLELIEDWHAGLELVRRVLREAGAPEGTGVRVRRRGGTVTADLSQPIPRD